MSSSVGRSEGAKPLADERKRVIEALGLEDLTGSAVLRRMRWRPTGAEAEAVESALSNDQSLLYPALHSLEASWQLKATWQSDANGTKHRTYRRRRLLPPRPGWSMRG